MNQENELAEEVDDELDESSEEDEVLLKAKTYPIDENWPDELKKQVQQINQMAAMINSDSDITEIETELNSVDEESEEDDEEDDDYEEDSNEVETVQEINSEESETFNDVF